MSPWRSRRSLPSSRWCKAWPKKAKRSSSRHSSRPAKVFHSKIALWAERQGIDTLLVDGKLVRVTNFNKLERFKEHTIDALVGEVDSSNAAEIPAIVRRAIEIGKGSARVRDSKGAYHILSSEMNCPSCARALSRSTEVVLVQLTARLVHALPGIWRRLGVVFQEGV